MANIAPGYGGALYVGDLGPDVTEAVLFETFSKVGHVASVRVCRDAATRRSLGYAYVNYHRMEDAEKALDVMNFKMIDNRQCRVMWSQRDPSLRKSGRGNVFVKNLAPAIDNKTMFDTFSMFGNILSCKVATNREGKSLGYGFVHYETEEAAKNAIERVNGKTILNEQVHVERFRPKKEREEVICIKNLDPAVTSQILVERCSEFGNVSEAKVIHDDKGCSGYVRMAQNASDVITRLNNQVIGNTQVHVERARRGVFFTNLYLRVPPVMTNEGLLELVKPFGTVTSSVVKDYVRKRVNAEDEKLKYAFANFATSESAQAAIQSLHNKDMDGQKLYVVPYVSRQERDRQLQEQSNQQKAEKNRKFAGRNVYIKNLADSVDDKRLHAEFGRFGAIYSAIVMPNADGKSRGFGFCCFEDPAAATEAIRTMNNQLLDGKQLYVAPFQRKEERRQLLEAQFGRKYPAYPPNYMYPPYNRAMFNQFPKYQMYPQQWANAAQRQMNPNYYPMAPMAAPGARYQLLPAQQQRPMPAGVPDQMGPRQRPAGRVPQGPRQQQRPQTQNRPRTQASANGSRLLNQLAHLNPQQQKQMLGETLFPQIQALEPNQAGKITGMLLEMDPSEIIHLIEDVGARTIKVQEALAVLQSAGADE